MGVRNEIVNLDANTKAGKVEGSVNPDSEKVTLASENLETVDQLPENPGAENVMERGGQISTGCKTTFGECRLDRLQWK